MRRGHFVSFIHSFGRSVGSSLFLSRSLSLSFSSLSRRVSAEVLLRQRNVLLVDETRRNGELGIGNRGCQFLLSSFQFAYSGGMASFSSLSFSRLHHLCNFYLHYHPLLELLLHINMALKAPTTFILNSCSSSPILTNTTTILKLRQKWNKNKRTALYDHVSTLALSNDNPPVHSRAYSSPRPPPPMPGSSKVPFRATT